MDVVFISNDYKTVFFAEIAKKLVNEGVVVHFLVFNKFYEKLLERYGCFKILRIKKNIEYTCSNFHEYESKLGVRELVWQDHVLRKQKWSYEYLKNYYCVVKDYIDKNNVKLVFGESSRGHETLLMRMCNRLDIFKGCYYLSPNVIRIPNGRFAFFLDELHEKVIYRKRTCDRLNLNMSVVKPKYYTSTKEYFNNKSSYWYVIKKLVMLPYDKYYDSEDPSKFDNRWDFLKERFKYYKNRFFYKAFVRTKRRVEKPYIFFPLHRYPESTVDVFGRYYEDQLSLIIDLWRKVPAYMSIVVKEHVTAIGDRPISFYKELNRFKGIIIYDENADSKVLIKNADYTVSITGTACLEAALMGKKSFVWGEPFFVKHKNVSQINYEKLRHCNEIEELDDASGYDDNEYMQYICEISYLGYIGDHLTEPYVLDEENINVVANSFLDIVRAVENENITIR